MKEKLFQIFFCIFVFWQPLLYSFLGESGTDLTGGAMRIALLGIFLTSWFFYFSFSPKSKDEGKMLLILVMFGAAYYSTRFFYTDVQAGTLNYYNGQMLRWGSDCTSACALGMTLPKLKNYNLIHKILPLESIALTPFMLNAILAGGTDAGQYAAGGGFNYQTLAYYMAILFCFSLFYSFVYQKKQHIIVKTAAIVTMLIQAVACCMAGGRGGLLLLVVYVLYMIYYLSKRKILSKGELTGVILLSIVGFLFVANSLDMWSSAGFSRSSGLADDDDRWLLWESAWHYVSDNNYMPYGLGGDFFSFGFYTHNVILDWCIELGIIGAFIMSIIYLKTYINIFKLTRNNEIFVVVMILAIFAVVMNMFSGYWISTAAIWLAFGTAMTKSNYSRWHTNKLARKKRSPLENSELRNLF